MQDTQAATVATPVVNPVNDGPQTTAVNGLSGDPEPVKVAAAEAADEDATTAP